MKRIKHYVIPAFAFLFCCMSCVKVNQGPYPPPTLTFSNDYTPMGYIKICRVYQDTTVPLNNKIIMTANCASLAGIKSYQVVMNGQVVEKTTLQDQKFNQEIDTFYMPQQSIHTENWEFSFTDEEGRSISKQIHINVQ